MLILTKSEIYKILSYEVLTRSCRYEIIFSKRNDIKEKLKCLLAYGECDACSILQVVTSAQYCVVTNIDLTPPHY
jgi:hypothetical protein